MSIPVVYTWPVAAQTAIVNNTQLDAGVHIFTFNGTYPVSSGGYINLDPIARELSITSASNLSGINFSITGIDTNGKSMTWTGAGPNATTIYTTNYQFLNVYSAIVSADMTAAASIGVGLHGTTNWFLYNYQATVPSLSVQSIVTGATITYSFEATLDNTKSYAALSTPNVFNTIATMTNATTSLFAVTTNPMYYARLKIADSAGTSSLISTFLQQGSS